MLGIMSTPIIFTRYAAISSSSRPGAGSVLHAHVSNELTIFVLVFQDHNYVPPVREEYRELFRGKIDLDHLTADAPVVVLLRIVLQQLIGWVRAPPLDSSH
jgi:hypothetical protein